MNERERDAGKVIVGEKQLKKQRRRIPWEQENKKGSLNLPVWGHLDASDRDKMLVRVDKISRELY